MSKLLRFLYGSSPKRVLLGVPVGAWATRDETVFLKVEQALLLIQTYAPLRFARLQQDVGCIFVMGVPGWRGMWHEKLRMCELQHAFVLHPDTSAAAVACVLVHEAMHARLDRWGLGYQEFQRVRIERICCKAQRAFARRLPAGDSLVEEADQAIAWGADPAVWTDKALQEGHLHELRQAGWPEWVLRCLSTLAQWRLRRRLAADAAVAASRRGARAASPERKPRGGSSR